MSGKVTAFGRDALPVMTNEHNRIHGGEMFTAGLSNAALGAGATLLIEFRVPSGTEVHLKDVQMYTGSDGYLEVIEAPTLTPGSTPIPVYNRNRAMASKTAGSLLFSDPSGISGGVLLEDLYTAGGNVASGIVREMDDEWLLSPGKTYLIRLTNRAGTAQEADLRVNWYEEKD